MTREEAIDLLNRAEYGVLSMVSQDGKPYGVPLNFCLVDSCIYFHSALEGHKVRNIQQNKHVSFCVVGDTEILPEKFTTKYESVIVFGEAEEVFGHEKQRALVALVRKYAPEFLEEGRRYIASHKDRTRVFKIKIDSLSGKARKA